MVQKMTNKLQETVDKLFDGMLLCPKTTSHQKIISDALTFLKQFQLLELYTGKSPILDTISVLKSSSNKNTEDFASASFKEPANRVFITNLAFQYFPPKSYSLTPNAFVLADNILHEITHQFLFDFDNKFKVFRLHKTERVELFLKVPHRNCYWDIDKFFHALMVYSVVAVWRKIASKLFSLEETVLFHQGLIDCVDIVRSLIHVIEPYTHVFSVNGILLLNAIKANIQDDEISVGFVFRLREIYDQDLERYKENSFENFEKAGSK
jgi:hypothetical protein